MRPRRALVGASIALAILLTTTGAAADPDPIPAPAPPMYLQIYGPAEVCLLPEKVRCRPLLPGRYLEESHWNELDAEFKRLQDQGTRLDAENKSLKDSLSGWSPGWKTLSATLVIGIVAGVYLHSHFD